MSDGAVVRPATGEDVDELARLRWQLYAEDDPAVEESFADYRERFVRFATIALEDDDWRAWVAEDGGRIVGALWRHRTPRIPQPGRGDPAPLAYVTNVYVEPAYRNTGLGARLLGHRGGCLTGRGLLARDGLAERPFVPLLRAGRLRAARRTRWSWIWAATGTTEDPRERATPS